MLLLILFVMNNDLQNSSRKRQILIYAPLFLWIGVIFFLSSGEASMSETSRFIRPFLEFLFPDASEETLRIYHGWIRKFAHLFEYAVLAFLAVRAFSGSTVKVLREHTYLAALALVLLIAAADEIIQTFDPSRTGSVADVVIDLAGGLAVIVVFSLRGRATK